MAERILIADDDSDIRRAIELNLELEGYEVISAEDGEQALQKALEEAPDLAILDVMMPKYDGVEVCRRLRADGRTAHICVIMLTARTLGADKVAGLSAGADDYMIKPFDPLELIARVQSTLRRNHEMRSVSPLTGLPGNITIESEVSHRLREERGVALCYADLDDFKAFNDHYGFLRGDQLLVATAQLLADVASSTTFVGHVGGDDFILVCDPEEMEELCSRAIEGFAAMVRSFFDEVDLERGYIEQSNRQGIAVHFPLVALSIGVAFWPGGPGGDARALAAVASEMKRFAKLTPGNHWAIDRRRPQKDPSPDAPGQPFPQV